MVAGMTTTTEAPTSFASWSIRLAVDTLAPRQNKAMNALDDASRRTQLDPVLLELVRARASQINGCAYCVDLHSRDARGAGETETRLFLLPVWREVPSFTARERAALELTEAVTRLSEGPVTDEVFERAAAQFADAELAELVWTITVINAWNRLGATTRAWPLP
jgi:AhpD family alkylhydroperoxidase